MAGALNWRNNILQFSNDEQKSCKSNASAATRCHLSSVVFTICVFFCFYVIVYSLLHFGLKQHLEGKLCCIQQKRLSCGFSNNWVTRCRISVLTAKTTAQWSLRKYMHPKLLENDRVVGFRCIQRNCRNDWVVYWTDESKETL